MTLLVAAILAATGAVIATAATRDRRARWRRARPFAGDERAAPEPALVPGSTVYLVYLGWTLVVAGAVTAAAVWS
jgi:hypothetical protein